MNKNTNPSTILPNEYRPYYVQNTVKEDKAFFKSSWYRGPMYRNYGKGHRTEQFMATIKAGQLSLPKYDLELVRRHNHKEFVQMFLSLFSSYCNRHQRPKFLLERLNAKHICVGKSLCFKLTRVDKTL